MLRSNRRSSQSNCSNKWDQCNISCRTSCVCGRKNQKYSKRIQTTLKKLTRTVYLHYIQKSNGCVLSVIHLSRHCVCAQVILYTVLVPVYLFTITINSVRCYCMIFCTRKSRQNVLWWQPTTATRVAYHFTVYTTTAVHRQKQFNSHNSKMSKSLQLARSNLSALYVATSRVDWLHSQAHKQALATDSALQQRLKMICILLDILLLRIVKVPRVTGNVAILRIVQDGSKE